MQERRKTVRHRAFKGASIEFGGGAIDCTVRNLSENGATLDVVPDVARVDHGRYLYNTRGCAECHGTNGAGRTVVSDGGMLVVAPNITAGPNGTTARYRVIDWVRTVRHGVKPNCNPVMIMPSEDYSRLSDEDMAALVAYLKTL